MKDQPSTEIEECSEFSNNNLEDDDENEEQFEVENNDNFPFS